MGHMAHHAIVATGYSPHVERAHIIAVAEEAKTNVTPGFTRPLPIVGPLIGSWANGYRSFLIAPDGSKEFWQESDRGDDLRSRIIARWRAEDVWIDWVLISFGGDDSDRAEIVDNPGRTPMT
jgi:hypothetical protein